MSLRFWFGGLLLTTALFVVFFWLVQVEVVKPLFNFLFQPQLVDTLDHSLDDLRTLSKLDPENRDLYRARFEDVEKLRSYIQILYLNQHNLNRSFLLFFGMTLVLFTGLGLTLTFLSRRYMNRMLHLFQEQLHILAEDGPQMPSNQARSGLFRRIDELVQAQWQSNKKAKQSLRQLEHLDTWQESARRHAHEIRTPLSAAQLEIDFLDAYFQRHMEAEPLNEWSTRKNHILTQFRRLKEFTDAFAAFGKLSKPKPSRRSMNQFLAHFAELYQSAWDDMEVLFDNRSQFEMIFDPECIRQVLVNLCQNAHSAMAQNQQSGTMTLALEEDEEFINCLLMDNGPGIPESIKNRVFEPYVTSRNVGEGMGLGLAISQKIMLDHGGYLELTKSDASGTTFTLKFPKGAAL